MRQKLVTATALLVGALIVFIIGLVASSKSNTPITQGTVCTKFMYDVENMNAQDGYNLFSTALKASIPYTQWQQQLQTLNASLGAASPKFVSQSTYTDANNNAVSYKRTYSLSNYGTAYSITCTVSTAGGNYVIDNFTNVPVKALH